MKSCHVCGKDDLVDGVNGRVEVEVMPEQGSNGIVVHCSAGEEIVSFREDCEVAYGGDIEGVVVDKCSVANGSYFPGLC